MSDFQDFLTHKLAQVAIGEFKPGQFQAAQQLYQAAVSTYTEGFLGAYLLREQDTDRAISVILWASEADMVANNSAVHQAILKQMAPLFSISPTVNTYEVVSEILPEGS
jgi:heme-degrading monooxygenase HmoA